MAAFVPRCHVLQKSQVTDLDLPVLESTILLLRSKGSTVNVSSSSISRTPSLPPFVKIAKSSRSDQLATSDGTKRMSRIRRGLIRRSFSKAIHESRPISFMLPLYHRCLRRCVFTVLHLRCVSRRARSVSDQILPA